MTPANTTRLAAAAAFAEGLLGLTAGAYFGGWWRLLLIPGLVWLVAGSGIGVATTRRRRLDEGGQARLAARAIHLAFSPWISWPGGVG